MVTSKPAKTAKHTYAERVLQAFSQVRKSHRRHAVHLATLRAQVKKNAEAQGDKLGPQWPIWVSKAIHRLKTEGILVAGSSGAVTMTPVGKKALGTARKSLSTITPSSAQEGAIWKTITHTPATPSPRGLKRPRHSAPQTPREYLDDEDADYLPSSSVSRRARAKRARPSVSPSKKSTSLMTKAELKAALQSLETQHANLLMRATSPLTDIDGEEERDRLRSELKARDQELERIRRQLDEMMVQTNPSEIGGVDIDRSSHRNVSSPTVEHRRPSSSVIRTQSGSLIHDVSKQPTPAPSSPDGNWEEEQESVDGHMDFEDPASINRLERDRPVTPLASPVGPATTNQDLDTNLPAEISRLKMLMEKTKRDNEKQVHVDGEKIFGLEKTLAARIIEVQKHKELHAELSEQVSLLEGKIVDRDFRVSCLEREIETLRSSLSSPSSEPVTKDTALKNASLARLHELEQTVGQHADAITLLSAEKASYQEQLDTVQRQLQQAEEALTRYSRRITLSEEEANHLRADLNHAQLELRQQEELLRVESEVHKTTVSDMSEVLTKREAELASLARQLEESSSQQIRLSEQCASKEASLRTSEASLVALKARAASFDLTMAERDSKVAELSETLANARTESHGLRNKIMSLELSIGELREEIDSATSSHSDLDVAHRQKCDEYNDLSVRLQEAEGNVVTLSGALLKAKDDTEALNHSLELAKDGENAWRDSLRRAEAAHEELAESLAAEVKQLREALSTSELKANEYNKKSAENQLEMARLRQQVAEAQGRIQEVEQSLRDTEARHSAERTTQKSAMVSMEESLAATRQETNSLLSQMRSAEMAHRKLQGELDARTQELSDVQGKLNAESNKAMGLEAKLAAAITKASDAEEDLLDLRSSKQADERTIDFLRESFAKLREAQMQSLAELDDKVHSAHSTPVSKRRLNA